MFGMNAGKQCVAMSLYAIVYKEIKSVNIWGGLMLNSILICGNSLYGIISQSINKSYDSSIAVAQWLADSLIAVAQWLADSLIAAQASLPRGNILYT